MQSPTAMLWGMIPAVPKERIRRAQLYVADATLCFWPLAGLPLPTNPLISFVTGKEFRRGRPSFFRQRRRPWLRPQRRAVGGLSALREDGL